jgi:hypothetical protein
MSDPKFWLLYLNFKIYNIKLSWLISHKFNSNSHIISSEFQKPTLSHTIPFSTITALNCNLTTQLKSISKLFRAHERRASFETWIVSWKYWYVVALEFYNPITNVNSIAIVYNSIQYYYRTIYSSNDSLSQRIRRKIF